MSWTTEADITNEYELQSVTDFTTAKAVWDRLLEIGRAFATAHSTARVVRYSANGIALIQRVEHRTQTVGGLSRDFAQTLADNLNYSNVVDHTFFGFYGTSSSYGVATVRVPCGPFSSSKLDVYYFIGSDTSYKRPSTSTVCYPGDGQTHTATAQRSDDADGWTVTLEIENYISPVNVRTPDVAWGTVSARTPVETRNFCPETNNGGSTVYRPGEVSSGVAISRQHRKVYVAKDGTTSVFQNQTTVVKEYRYLNANEAESLVSSESAANSKCLDVSVLVSWNSSGSTVTKNVTVRGGGTDGKTAATDKEASARFDGDERQWTVTVVETTWQVTTS